MRKQNKTNESGRSMVEMLGVLAIIGVLSIAGTAGYKYAMNQYKFNQVLEVVNRFILSYDTEYEKPEGESPYDEAPGYDVKNQNIALDYFCDTYLGEDFCGTVSDRAGKYWVDGRKEGNNNAGLGFQILIAANYDAAKFGSNIALCIENIECDPFLTIVEKQYGSRILGYSRMSGGIKQTATEMCKDRWAGCIHFPW